MARTMTQFTKQGLPRWWPRRFTRLPLALEIALALLLKITLLALLWHFFFSHPQARKMKMPLPQVEQHLLNSIPASPVPPSPPFSETTTKAEHERYR
jgi:hypothetical protein